MRLSLPLVLLMLCGLILLCACAHGSVTKDDLKLVFAEDDEENFDGDTLLDELEGSESSSSMIRSKPSTKKIKQDQVSKVHEDYKNKKRNQKMSMKVKPGPDADEKSNKEYDAMKYKFRKEANRELKNKVFAGDQDGYLKAKLPKTADKHVGFNEMRRNLRENFHKNKNSNNDNNSNNNNNKSSSSSSSSSSNNNNNNNNNSIPPRKGQRDNADELENKAVQRAKIQSDFKNEVRERMGDVQWVPDVGRSYHVTHPLERTPKQDRARGVNIGTADRKRAAEDRLRRNGQTNPKLPNYEVSESGTHFRKDGGVAKPMKDAKPDKVVVNPMFKPKLTD